MKSDNKKNPVQGFVDENRFVKHVVVHNKGKTVFFPNPESDKKQYFEEIINEQRNGSSTGQLFFSTHNGYVYIYRKDKSIYICECTNDVSVSQVKMEFDAFIEESQKQGRFPKFITSLFDR